MSSVKVSGNASGTGTLTIAAPNTSTDYTLTLPAATTTLVGTDATQTLTNKTLTSPTMTTPTIDSAQIPTVSGTAPIYMCRAWVRFNSAGTIAASGNVTSVTKNGTGDYTVNFTNAMPDANYAANITSQSNGGIVDAVCVKDGVAPTTSALRVFNCSATTGAGRDPTLMYVAVFR